MPATGPVTSVTRRGESTREPRPALRRAGVRTKDEINRERYALKALRGDFDDLPADGAGRARESLRAVRL